MPASRPTARIEQHTLHRAHRGLDGLLAQLETMTRLCDALPAAELDAAFDRLLREIDRTLGRHVQWEEQVCFPDTERAPGADWATRLLRLQHAQIAAAIETLAADRRQVAAEPGRPAGPGRRDGVGRHLHVLHALLTSHLEQEERAILELLLELPD